MNSASALAIGIKAQNQRPPAVSASSTSGAIAATTTAGTVSNPAGTRTSGVVIVAAQLGSTADTLATPTGWTLLLGPISTTGTGTNTKAYVFSRTIDGTEGATLGFTKTGTAAQWRLTAAYMPNTAGIGATASNTVATNTTDAAPVLPGLTPLANRSTVLGVVVMRNTTTFVVPSHFVDVTQSVSAFNIDVCRRAPVVAGTAYGTATGSTGVTTSKWITFSIEIKAT